MHAASVWVLAAVALWSTWQSASELFVARYSDVDPPLTRGRALAIAGQTLVGVLASILTVATL